MLRLSQTSTVRIACAARFYAPSEDLKKLFSSDFDVQKYPVDIVPSDSTLFAKFLYKSCEAKSSFDIVLNDFKSIQVASTKLPVFWERTAEVEKIPELKNLSPATTFTLHWMQSNGMLEHIPAVREAFETYVNAQRKRIVAKVYVGDEKDISTINNAKKAAQELHKSKPELSGTSIDFKIVVENEIVSGFAVEVAGSYLNEAKGADVATATTSGDVDYTNVAAAKIFKTVWADNVETEVLRKYFDQLAQFDEEEAKMGV